MLAFALGFRSGQTSDRVDICDPKLIAMSIDFILNNQQVIEEHLSNFTGKPIHLDAERIQTLASVRFDSSSKCSFITFHKTHTDQSSIFFFEQANSSSKVFFFSSDVLKHVNPSILKNFNLFLAKPRSGRVIMYHCIDLSDHFATGSISKHRFRSFPKWLWKLIGKNEYHYCNRLSEHDFLTLFGPHGLIATKSDPDLGILEVWCDSQKSLR